MAAPSQTRPQFNNAKQLIAYLNDNGIGLPQIDPSTGAYEPEVFVTPIHFGEMPQPLHDQTSVNNYIDMFLRAVEGDIQNKGFKAKIDAVMRQNLSAGDYQFIRRALDNNGRA